MRLRHQIRHFSSQYDDKAHAPGLREAALTRKLPPSLPLRKLGQLVRDDALVPRFERTARVGDGVVFGAPSGKAYLRTRPENCAQRRHLRGTAPLDHVQGGQHLGRLDRGDRCAERVNIDIEATAVVELVEFLAGLIGFDPEIGEGWTCPVMMEPI